MVVRKLRYSNKGGFERHSNRELVQEAKQSQEQKKLSFQNKLIETKNSFYSNSTTNRYLKEKAFEKTRDEAYKRGSEMFFTKKLLEVFNKSLVIDEYFINENSDTIANYFVSKLKETANGNIFELMESVKNNSEYLFNLVEACKEKGQKVSKKAANKVKENDDSIIDDIFDEVEEDDKDDDNVDVDMDAEEAANCIKEKVVKVIQDEEKANEDKKKLVDDLTSANSTLGENVSLYKTVPNERYSLFNSIMISNHKSCLKAITEGTISVDNGSNYVTLSESGEATVNMDYVLFDTILEYTRLELLNTLRITNHTTSQLRSMAETIAYK